MSVSEPLKDRADFLLIIDKIGDHEGVDCGHGAGFGGGEYAAEDDERCHQGQISFLGRGCKFRGMGTYV